MRSVVVLFLFFPGLALGHNGGTYSLGFDGRTTYVGIVDRTLDCSADLTVECLVKFTALDGEQTIMAKTELPQVGDAWTWEFGLIKTAAGGPGGNTIRFLLGSMIGGSSQHLQSTSVVKADTWYHIAAVVNGSTMLLYVNGALEATGNFTLKRRPDDDGGLTFGASPEFAAGFAGEGSLLNGELDDVRVWGYPRTGGQIKGGALLVLEGDEAGLQAYYAMSNGGGQTLDDDQKDGKNRGTIVNGTWVSASGLPVSLTSFTARVQDATAFLEWATATEVNNYGFAVERREESGGGWVVVGFVPGHGTTVARHHYAYTDASVSPGRHIYRLKQIDLDGRMQYSEPVVVDIAALMTEVAAPAAVPGSMTLSQNYPNPFNPSTMIEFTIAKAGRAKLVVYDMLGREVAVLADGEFAAGERHRVQLDGSRLTSGMYFYRLTSDGTNMVRSLTLTK